MYCVNLNMICKANTYNKQALDEHLSTCVLVPRTLEVVVLGEVGGDAATLGHLGLQDVLLVQEEDQTSFQEEPAGKVLVRRVWGDCYEEKGRKYTIL